MLGIQSIVAARHSLGRLVRVTVWVDSSARDRCRGQPRQLARGAGRMVQNTWMWHALPAQSRLDGTLSRLWAARWNIEPARRGARTGHPLLRCRAPGARVRGRQEAAAHWRRRSVPRQHRCSRRPQLRASRQFLDSTDALGDLSCARAVITACVRHTRLSDPVCIFAFANHHETQPLPDRDVSVLGGRGIQT